jgi:hypothetical protein
MPPHAPYRYVTTFDGNRWPIGPPNRVYSDVSRFWTIFDLAHRTPARYNRSVTAEFKLSLLDCDRSDPLADFFDARAAITVRGVACETAFVVAGRDLQAFATDLGRVAPAANASALLLGGWDAERCLRLQVTRAQHSDAGVARVWMDSDVSEDGLQSSMETQFVVPLAALTRFSMDIHQLVEERTLGDATLTGEADGNE